MTITYAKILLKLGFFDRWLFNRRKEKMFKKLEKTYYGTGVINQNFGLYTYVSLPVKALGFYTVGWVHKRTPFHGDISYHWSIGNNVKSCLVDHMQKL